MSIKVELHPRVVVYLAGLPEVDRDNFVARLEEVRQAPINRSTRHTEREIRRRELRRFEFGRGVARIAIFEFDRNADRIRVLKCRFTKPRRLRGSGMDRPEGLDERV